jgi:COP9 signalosome complex subunit 1
LADRKFLDAANQLTSVPLADEGNPFASGVASAEDVALYETLCALATMDRDQLQRLLETQANGFLDLAPSLRYVLQHYCRADYPGCLRILYQLRPALELDMFLEPHLEKLFDTIMQKCIIEYLKPYRKVNLVHMASIFSTPIDRLIPMLAELIGAGRIPHARIDCLEQTLERRTDEALVQRQLTTKKKILAMEQDILNDAHAMIIRVACLENEGDDRRKPSYAVEYMESDDDDDNDGEPMDLVAGNPEDVY